MRAADIARLIALKGETVTLRRLSGTARIPFDVVIQAVVDIGAASVVVGDVQESADRVIFLSEPLSLAGWRLPPRHGDQIIYQDGRTTTVWGPVPAHLVEAGSYAYVANVRGGM
jgi:hypothetical protein